MSIGSFFKSFSFKNLGHYIAVAARDIVNIGGKALQTETVVEGVTQLIAPSAVEIERAIYSASGYLIHAASTVTSVANGSNTLTITGIAASEIADFKALAEYFKGHAEASGVKV